MPPRVKRKKRVRELPDKGNLSSVSIVLGVDPKTVVRWIQEDGADFAEVYQNGVYRKYAIGKAKLVQFLEHTGRYKQTEEY